MMTKEGFEKCMSWAERHIGVPAVRFLVKLLTAVTAAAYGIVVLRLIWEQDTRLWRILLVPAAGFFVVTLLRKAIGAKRPYETYGFTPLLQKDTKGNSFPSRHVFSNMVIAVAVCSVSVPLGVFLLLCGACLAVLRVLAGVHYPRDVLAGAVLAILFGLAAG